MGDLSPHFSGAEFRCRHCKKLQVHPALIDALEDLRAIGYPQGLVVRSGYRCTAHNRTVGGVKSSQHMLGTAADIDPRMTLQRVLELEIFSGIGWQRHGGTQMVVHVDVRHAVGSGMSPEMPAIWGYDALGRVL